MNDDQELEKTRSLDDLSKMVKDEAKNHKEYTKEIQSISKEEMFNTLVAKKDDLTKSIKEEEAKSLKKENLITKFQKLPKYTKMGIIAGIIILIAIIIGGIVIVINSKKKVNPVTPNDEVIVIKDNYTYKDGTLIFEDDNHNELGQYECTNKDQNLCYVAYLNNSEDPFMVTKNIYEDGSSVPVRSQIYFNKYVFIYDQATTTSNIIYLYDMLNKEVKQEYTAIKSYNISKDNYLIVKNKNNKYGLINLTNNEIKQVIDFNYDFLGIIPKDDDKYLVATNSKGSYLISYANEYITKALKGTIIDYNDTYLVVKTNNKYSINDYNAEEYNKNYDYISLINNDYVAVVSNNMLYIRGYGDNKYNEVGYSLNNSNYALENIYKADNTKISSSYAYKVSINDTNATIKIYSTSGETEQALSLVDGNISATKTYYSYFDGILYFYSDEAKNNLLGSYTCTNKNSDSTDFNSCYPAFDTTFHDTYTYPAATKHAMIPIFNKRFVFVYDAPALVNDSNIEIKLYDLSVSKVLGTYKAVDTNTENNNGVLSLKDTSSQNVIAKNRSNKFGMINITSNNVTSVYEFSYNAMEYFTTKDTLVQNADNTWKLLYSKNTGSSNYPGKIMTYNDKYFVIKIDGQDYIYDNSGSKISAGYNYISLINTSYYAAVNSNNTLDIYNYLNNKINSTPYILNSKDYYNTQTPAFKISASNQTISIDVLNNGVYVNTKLIDPTTSIGEEPNASN